MTMSTRLERSLPTILGDLAAGPTPDYIDDVLASTARTRQRPAWTFPERWIPMADIAERRTFAPATSWRTIAVLVLLLALVAGTVAVYVGTQRTRVPAPFGPASNGLVAFYADGDTWTIDPATGERRLLIQDAENDFGTVYSPDGTRLAILSIAPGGGNRIRITSPDGTGPTYLAPDPFVNLHAWPWSPDGRSIAAIHEVDGAQVLSIVPTDGGPIRTLDLAGITPMDPAWRPPDGGELMFRGERDGRVDLYLIRADGTDLRPLEVPGSGPLAAADQLRGGDWSPDGARIAYMAAQPTAGGDPELRTHVDAADGTLHIEFPAPPGTDDAWPVWSPDGHRLVAVRSGSAGSWPVIINADGGLRDFPQFTSGGWDLRWSPDGGSILAFDLDGRRAIRIDPSTGTQIGDAWTDLDWPAWQRRP